MMHPGFLHWWRSSRSRSCAGSGCSPEGVHEAHWHGHDDGGGGFGVRRPLRYLAWKLELEERQVAELASIIDALKTERAQADVDFRRATSSIAAAFEGAALDQAALDAAAEQRVEAEQRRQRAVSTALGRIHAVLDEEQRKRFAYLVRTGTLQL